MINQYDFLKELKMCLHELSLVDDTMEAIGLPKKHQRLRKWIIRITIGYIVYVFYQFTIPAYTSLIFYNSYPSIREIVHMFLHLFFPEFVYISSALIWETIVGCVSFRFHQINHRLHIFYSELFENNADYRRQNRSNLVCQRISEIKDRKQCIWITM
ncbi:hypothetical protein ALC56_11239 [Trachymyrmex septentrionalis]|uniref:Uncharacterized protein n=1 Tax=Trachymyrmex septentrionalis TaxID=34720 RepID=A0A151JTN2_9HYME|nr:hypothetical protein ALC56_11239 [Trachymyrmex septentrionalis]